MYLVSFYYTIVKTGKIVTLSTTVIFTIINPFHVLVFIILLHRVIIIIKSSLIDVTMYVSETNEFSIISQNTILFRYIKSEISFTLIEYRLNKLYQEYYYLLNYIIIDLKTKISLD